MKYTHITIEEREKIQEGLWQKKSLRQIGKEIGRPHSAVSREIQKNLPKERYRYSPHQANQRALLKRGSRGRKDRLKNNFVREYVNSHLKLRWSPEQIAGRMPKEIGQKISHEAIYQYIYNQVHRNGYGLLKPGKEDLRPYLRRRRKRRVRRGGRRCQRVLKPQGISIDERPDIVNTRSRIGDWEGDTVESRNHRPGVNTLTERKIGYVFITKLESKTSRETVDAVKKRMSVLPKEVRHTLTLDNGPENSDWQSMETEVDISVYKTHPYCSWERGTNENTNGLIRDYFSKDTDFTEISDEEIAMVEYYLNTRPRKRLGWQTPLEVLSGALRG